MHLASRNGKFLQNYICKKYLMSVLSFKTPPNLFLPPSQCLFSCTPLLPPMLQTPALRSQTASESFKQVIKIPVQPAHMDPLTPQHVQGSIPYIQGNKPRWAAPLQQLNIIRLCTDKLQWGVSVGVGGLPRQCLGLEQPKEPVQCQ